MLGIETNARWTAVRSALAVFQEMRAEPRLRLDVQHVNDRLCSQERYLAMRATGIYDRVGVYLHYSADGDLLYVGKTERGFDRFWGSRPEDARFTDVVVVEREFRTLIVPLERFLIEQLGPRDNVR